MRVLGLRGAESVDEALPQLVSCFVLTPHVVKRVFKGKDSSYVDRFVIGHFVRHFDREVVRTSVGEGIFEGVCAQRQGKSRRL